MNQTMENVFKSKSNKLNLNPSKTKFMIFNSKGSNEINIRINGEAIERVWRQGQEKSF